MSIINEAIKKARKEFEATATQVSEGITAGKERLIKADPDSSEARWRTVIVVSLVFVVSLLGSLLLYRHVTSLDATYSPETPDLRPSAAPLSAARAPRGKRASSAANISRIMELNGIVYGPKEKWAIINDRIVREGDSVPGGRLTFIAENLVKVKDKASGEEIVLELR